MTTKVEPSIEPISVTLFRVVVRCATNHAEIE